MSSQDSDDYDKLSPAEREIRDKADRQREAEEQTGVFLISGAWFYSPNLSLSTPLFMETISARRRHRSSRF